MNKKILLYLVIIILAIISICLYKQNIKQKENLKELELSLNENKEKEQLIIKYKEDLDTIRKLKQEILGQQNKLNEFNIQITDFTETLVKNQEKLYELES